MVEEVKIKLTLEQKKAIKAIKDVADNGKRLEKRFKGHIGKINDAFSVWAGNVAAMATARVFSGIANQINGVVDAASKLEVFEVQFKTILGSAEAAEQQIRDLQEFAAKTPFTIEGLALATRQLLSFGVAQEDIIPTMGKIGDLAAAVGVSIDELTIPYGRLISTQKLTLIELDKFADRGINLYGKLSKATGISLKDIRDEISKGRIPFEEFTKALSEMTSEGGIFFGSMEKQSRTLMGVLSDLEDNFFNLQGEIGKALSPAIIEVAKELTKTFEQLGIAFKENGPAISKTLVSLADVLLITPSKFWISFFAGDTSLAGNATRVKEINSELTNLNGKIENIKATLDQTKNIETLLGIEGVKKLEKRMVSLTAQTGELVSERTKLLEIEQKSAEIQAGLKKGEVPEAEDDPRFQLELKVANKLAELRDQEALAREEFLLTKDVLEGELVDASFEKLVEDVGKEQAIRLKAKENLIAQETDFNKRLAKTQLLGAETAVATQKNKRKQLAIVQKDELHDRDVFLSTAATLSSAKNKELAAIGKAAAILQIAIKTPPAIASSFEFGTRLGGPILGGIFAGIASTAMGLQAAKIAGIGFQDGGIVPGTPSATDNQIANVRAPEMILTPEQQAELFNMAKTGTGGGGATTIILEVDGRELARVVKDAQEEGFELAS